MERKGIQTERGNINRGVIHRNMTLEQAKEMLADTVRKVQDIWGVDVKEAMPEMENEVIGLIDKVAKQKGRLALPIIKGKYLYKMTDRTAIQSTDNAKSFIHTRKIDSFSSLRKFMADNEQRYSRLEETRLSKWQMLDRLKELSKIYAMFEACCSIYKESQSLKGIAKLRYDKEHKDSLEKYPAIKERLQNLLQKGEKIIPPKWKEEIRMLQAECENISKEQIKIEKELAYAEVISFNKKNHEREMQNEDRQNSRKTEHDKKRDEERL